MIITAIPRQAKTLNLGPYQNFSDRVGFITKPKKVRKNLASSRGERIGKREGLTSERNKALRELHGTASCPLDAAAGDIVREMALFQGKTPKLPVY